MALVLLEHGDLGKREEQVFLSSHRHTPLFPWTQQGAESPLAALMVYNPHKK